MAAELQLQAHVVEKDYALGWFLAGIAAHPEIGPSWVFKGGTCLKKCFFETYRFSEDLDFTLQDAAHLDEAFLAQVFEEIGEWVYDACGLQLPPEARKFEVFKRKKLLNEFLIPAQSELEEHRDKPFRKVQILVVCDMLLTLRLALAQAISLTDLLRPRGRSDCWW